MLINDGRECVRLIQSMKSQILSRGFLKIQLLNILWVGKYYFLTCCKVVGSMVLISLFYEGLALTSSQKELFLKIGINLFNIFIIFRMMYLGVKISVKSDGDSRKLILQVVRVFVGMAIFYRFGGLNVETYDSILQGFKQNNFDYLLNSYGTYFFSACLYVISYKSYYKRVFVGSVHIHSLKDNQLSWDANDWIDNFIFPNRVKEEMSFGKSGSVEVYFRLNYSWIMIGKYFTSSVWVDDEKENEEVTKTFMLQ